MIDTLLGADRWLFGALNSGLHWAPFDALMMALSEVKHLYLLVGLLICGLVWRGGPNGRAAAVLIILALIASDQLASALIKPLVHRMRPCHDLAGVFMLGECGGGYSFPSTHAVNSFAAMAVLAQYFPRRRVWCYVLAAAIGYSRIHIGAHYPLDVLGGAALGYGIGRGVVVAWRRAQPFAPMIFVGMKDWYHALRRLVEWISARRDALPVLSGLLLAFAFPGVHTGVTASVGLVPLLFAIENMKERTWRRYVRMFYVAFFVFHGIANYWVGGWSAEADPFLMIACVALMIVHPFFLMLPMIGYVWIRRRAGLAAGLLSLPMLWVAFEYMHSIGDIGYPWLTLGNSQTYYPEGIQFIEYTGVYGASFVLVAQDALIFWMMTRLRSGAPLAQLRLAMIALIATVAVPALHAEWLYRDNAVHHQSLPQVRVGIVQPNIDPWVKWSGEDTEQQVTQMKSMTRTLLASRPEVVIWPETAIPYYIALPAHAMECDALHRFVDSTGVPVITGVPDYVLYRPGQWHPADAQPLRGGMFTASFNSSTIVRPFDQSLPMYHKMQLVPFGERTPFVDAVPALADVIKWGVGLSGWSKGTAYTLFPVVHNGDTTRVYSMICYESVYPGLVREFVNRGATLLTVMTNDGWYGRSAGPVQHQQYAILRAIENRRAIARCANTGISCFIDRFGTVTQRTPLFEPAAITGVCEENAAMTFYSTHGDMFAIVCCVFVAIGIGGAWIRTMLNRSRGAAVVASVS